MTTTHHIYYVPSYFLKCLLPLLLIAGAFLSPTVVTGQTDFGCPAGFYQYLNAADQLTQYNPETGLFENVGSSTPSNDFHSLGYNIEDDYMYGIDRTTDQLFQLNNDGTATLLGSITGWPGSDNGAFDRSGNFYAQTGSNLYMVDVSGVPPYSFTTTALSPTPAFLGDIVFHQPSGLFYGMNTTTLYAINPTTGAVTTTAITGIPGTAGASFGGAFTDIDDKLYFFNNGNGEIYEIDLGTNTATLAYVSTPNSSNDAASCPLACPPGLDTDGDAVPDDCDLDDDNDGILDTNECYGTQTDGTLISDALGGTGVMTSRPTWNTMLSNLETSQYTIESFESFAANDPLTSTAYQGFSLTATHSHAAEVDIDGSQYGTAPLTGSLQGTVEMNFTNPTVTLSFDFDDPVVGFGINLGDIHDGGANSQLIIQFDGATVWESTDWVGNNGTGTVTNSITGESQTLGNQIFGFIGYYDLTNPVSNVTITYNGLLSSDNFVFDDISIIYPGCDTDGDGITDHLDLDSDNDGCFDAIEGGGSFDYPDLAANYSLEDGTNVDSDGIPTAAGSPQSAGTSTDPATQATECDPCQNTNHIDYNPDDKDGDGIEDHCDVDDDNDGILDADEGCPTPTSSTLDIFGTWGPSGTVITLDANNAYTATNVNGTGVDIRFTEVEGGRTGFPRTLTNVIESIQGSTFAGTGVTSAIDGTTTIYATLKYNIEFFETGTTDPVDVCNFSIILGDIDALELYGEFTQSAIFSEVPEHVTLANDPTTGYYLSSDNTNIFNNTDEGDFTLTTFGAINSFGFTAEKASAGSNLGIFLKDITFSLCDCVGVDTDNDGLPDHLDLDSDNDGCFDAIEGGGTFDYPDLADNFSLEDGTAVDADGLPAVMAGTEQAPGSSTNPAVQATECDPCQNTNHIDYDPTDTDGDMVEDICDLDDDNDGILDTDEGCTAPTANNLDIFATWGASGTVITLDGDNSYTATNVNGTGLDIRFTEVEGGIAGFPRTFTNVTPSIQGSSNFDPNNTSLIDLTSTARGRLQYNIEFLVTGTDTPADVCNFSFTLGDVDNAELYGTFTENVLFSEIPENVTLINHPTTGPYLQATGTGVPNNSDAADISVTTFGTVSSIGFVTERFTTSQYGIFIKDIQFTLCDCVGVDTDMDGIPNHLDLDSDNDGCPDALEGDGTFQYADLAGNFSLEDGTAVDADGIPTIAGSPQGAGTSTDASQSSTCDPCQNTSHPNYDPTDTDGDMVVDICDLDSDNDGILDAVECVLANATVAETSEDLTGTGITPDVASGTFSFGDGTNGTWDLTTTSPTTLDVGGNPYNPTTFPVSNYGATNTNGYLNITYSGAPFYDVTTTLDLTGEPVLVTLASGTSAVFSFENFTVSWTGGGYATVFDPSDQLDVADGTLIPSGATVTNLDLSLGAGANVWSIQLPFGATQVSFTTNGGNVNETMRFRLQKCPDTDADGIADYLDLDSDDDGCPDALEGGGGFDYPDLVANNSLDNNGTNVDADGIPTAAGSPQTAGSSTDPAVQPITCDPCLNGNHPGNLPGDFDGDLVFDFCDLDDDNDGIPDAVECVLQTGTMAIDNPADLDGTGTGTIAYPDGSAGTWSLATTTAGGFTNISSHGINGAGHYWAEFNGPQFSGGGYTMDVTFSITGPDAQIHFQPNMGTGSTIQNNLINFTLTWTGGGSAVVSDPDNELDLADGEEIVSGVSFNQIPTIPANNTLDWSITLPDGVTNVTISTGVGSLLEGLAFYTTSCPDTDLDGMADFRDTNSDNDDCPDALEGDGALEATDLVSVSSTSALALPVDADGIPISAGAGQNAGTSLDASLLDPDCLAPLPVELLTFTGRITDEGSLLNWTTASEMDNDYFSVQRAKDGIQFEEIGIVDGNGTSTEEIDYTFLDRTPHQGINYYRLQQFDFNGDSEFSNTVTLMYGMDNSLVLFPNPTRGELNWTLVADKEEEVRLEIFDALGRLVLSRQIQVQTGTNDSKIDVRHLPSGYYHLMLGGEGYIFQGKFIRAE